MNETIAVSANIIDGMTIKDFAAYYKADEKKVCEYLNVTPKIPAAEIGKQKLAETLEILFTEEETEPEIWFPHFVSTIDQPPLIGEIDPPPLATRLYQKP